MATIPLPQLQELPAGIVSLQDHAVYAQQQLDAAQWAFFAGAAADGQTAQANVQAWQALTLWPRVLRNMAQGNTHTQLLGVALDWPVLLAPVAHLHAAHPDGEIAVAYAAQACATGMVLSAQSATPVEVVQAILQQDPPHTPPLLFQMYWQADRDTTLALVQRAQQAGCRAIVLTVDAPVQGVRDAERRAPLQLPPHWRSAHVPTATQHLSGAGLCHGAAQHAPTWDDVAWLLRHAPLPVVLKGITHPDDAVLAQDHGASGIVVSNHGGRTLDTLPATAKLLPRIRQAVGADYTVLVDGGIRRGTDVFKAIALGANAVLLGRPYAYGLANAGARGVAHVLKVLRDEFEAAMVLTGCSHIKNIQSHHICD